MIGKNPEAQLQVTRRRFLEQAAAAAAAAKIVKSAEAPMSTENKQGGYRFLPAIAPFSAGAAAMKGFEVVHVAFNPPPPYRRGFELIDRHLKAQRRPPQALCGIELRSPRQLSFSGFDEFNEGYIAQLKQRDILVSGVNPVARTNVVPEVDPPSEVVLYGFSYTSASRSATPTFVNAGGGEIGGSGRGPENIIRRGDVSEIGMRDKASHVLGLMEERLRGLGVGWADVTAVDVYTAQNIFPLLKTLLLPRLGPAKMRGVCWHFTRPPILELEYEMDMRGCAREMILRSA